MTVYLWLLIGLVSTSIVVYLKGNLTFKDLPVLMLSIGMGPFIIPLIIFYAGLSTTPDVILWQKSTPRWKSNIEENRKWK